MRSCEHQTILYVYDYVSHNFCFVRCLYIFVMRGFRAILLFSFSFSASISFSAKGVKEQSIHVPEYEMREMRKGGENEL